MKRLGKIVFGDLDLAGGRMLKVGGFVLLFSALSALLGPKEFWFSYLLGFVFVASIVLGAMIIHMIHNLTGGAWGIPVKGVLEAVMRTLPLLFVLFIPILFGLKNLYGWADPVIQASSTHFQQKAVYLNPTFFAVRSFICFAIWFFIAFGLIKWSNERAKLQVLSGLGLFVYSVTIFFVSLDWMLSLEPNWHSTIFAPLFIAGSALSALAFAVVYASFLVRREPLKDLVNKSQFNDLGSLLLLFVMLWAYMAFSQFLIIWSGNLPDEITWYMARSKDGWDIVAGLLVIFHFLLPFILLLARFVKRSARLLALVAIGIILMRYLDFSWHIMPLIHQSFLDIKAVNVLLPIGMVFVWLSAFRGHIK